MFGTAYKCIVIQFQQELLLRLALAQKMCVLIKTKVFHATEFKSTRVDVVCFSPVSRGLVYG